MLIFNFYVVRLLVFHHIASFLDRIDFIITVQAHWNYGCSAHRVDPAPHWWRENQGEVVLRAPGGQPYYVVRVVWLICIWDGCNDDYGRPHTLWLCAWGFVEVTFGWCVYCRIQGRTVVHQIASVHSSLHAPGGTVPCEGLWRWHPRVIDLLCMWTLMWFQTRLFKQGCFGQLHISQWKKNPTISSSSFLIWKSPTRIALSFKVTVAHMTLKVQS